MRYELKRNKNGMITQCENNADGNNIYTQREELNKLALENLARPTPGKLGGLSNLQVFNFTISDIETGAFSIINKEYNTTSTFPANATQTIMFGVDGANNKALYYNIVGVKADYRPNTSSVVDQLSAESFIEFYILQNNESSTTSLGTKIPQPAPLSGNGGGAVTFSTDGNINGAQSFSIDFTQVPISDFANKGLRASGLALKTIYFRFDAPVTADNIQIDVQVYVDVTSVSTTY